MPICPQKAADTAATPAASASVLTMSKDARDAQETLTSENAELTPKKMSKNPCAVCGCHFLTALRFAVLHEISNILDTGLDKVPRSCAQ
jgi:hypothetical protein